MRNEIIEEIDQLLRRLHTVSPNYDFLERDKWALVGECERFGNDLCNAATNHNRQLGAIVYTVRDAQKKLRDLKIKVGKLQSKIRP